MHLAFDVAAGVDASGIVFSLDIVVTVEDFPGTNLLVARFDRIEATELVPTGFASEGIGNLSVITLGLNVLKTCLVCIELTSNPDFS